MPKHSPTQKCEKNNISCMSSGLTERKFHFVIKYEECHIQTIKLDRHPDMKYV